jgi:hypothetical protein
MVDIGCSSAWKYDAYAFVFIHKFISSQKVHVSEVGKELYLDRIYFCGYGD